MVKMAEPAHQDDHDDHEETPGYKPPTAKALDDIVNQDQEDESLQKYKQALLGADLGKQACPFPDDPRRVIVTKLAVLVQDHDDLELDLSGDLTLLTKSPFSLKEGCQYRVKIYFYVQREIVTGLKYVQRSMRKGIQVDKETYMVGSYGPKNDLQSYTTALETAPSGMLARGTYIMKSLFTDDDKNEHLKWEWKLELKK
jgi:Rho GDP-dissociation inhibitor